MGYSAGCNRDISIPAWDKHQNPQSYPQQARPSLTWVRPSLRLSTTKSRPRIGLNLGH